MNKAKKTKAIAHPVALLPMPQAQPAGAGTEVSVLAIIERAVTNPRIDVNKMQKLLDMYERVQEAKAESEFSNAMCDCQQDIQAVAVNAYNEHTKSWYAKLEAVDAVIRPVYTKHGFSMNFNSATLPDGRIEVSCLVRHKAGHKEKHMLTGALDTTGAKGTFNKTGIQGLGSTVSYLRRYLTCMIFNVIIKGEDKDGNSQKPAKSSDEFNDMVHADNGSASELKDSLGKIASKKERVAFLTKNINTIHALAKEGKEDAIAELHALADKGS